ncbi:MAG: hypothetical protein RIS70_2422 [Planctomycetota bacterium]
MMMSQAADHRDQVEKSIGNVHQKQSVGAQMCQIGCDAFRGQQMNRNRIVAERIENQEIERLQLPRLSLLRRSRKCQASVTD